MNLSLRKIPTWAFSLLLAAAGARAPAGTVSLVKNGEAQATVVLADDATMTAQYAAEELVEHIRLATDAILPIVHESEIPADTPSRIFVGVTQAARNIGIRPEDLVHDEFILRTVGPDLYVLGLEDPFRDRVMTGSPEQRILHGGQATDEQTAPQGTMYGVYELLQRYAGVRWLWPGELGTYVPKTGSIVITESLDENHPPKLGFRRHAWYQIRRAAIRAAPGQYDPVRELVSFSSSVIQNYRDDLDIYLARHRLGYSEPKPRTRHYFSGWWQKYGEEHPEWFMLNEAGKRGPLPGGSTRHVAMCVSNPELHHYLVEEAWDGQDTLTLGEVDLRLFCHCENCLAWDGPQPDDYPAGVQAHHQPRMVSDRYARFWKKIQEMAAERNPNVTVTTYLYWNYLPAPTGDIELNRNIYGEFAPWTGPMTCYPMPEEVDQWLREQWKSWVDTGIRIAYRPNILHCTYVMPQVSTWQAGEFFQFAYAHGMEGFRFDSLFGHWATQGPMLYMYMRLAWDPEIPIKQVREEYFSAFGPAAGQVEEYFDFWEEYCRDRPGGLLINPRRAAEAFPSEVIARGKEKLAKALEAADGAGAGEYAERVKFLKAGLKHARLSAEFIATTDNGQTPADPEKYARTREALEKLIKFRRRHEHLYIADLHSASSREMSRLGINFKDFIEKAGENLTD